MALPYLGNTLKIYQSEIQLTRESLSNPTTVARLLQPEFLEEMAYKNNL